MCAGVFYWYLNLLQESGKSCHFTSVQTKPFPQGCWPIPRSSEAWAWGSFQSSQTFWSTAYQRNTWTSHADRGEVPLDARDLTSGASTRWNVIICCPSWEGKSSLLLATWSILALLLKYVFKTDHGPQYLCPTWAMQLHRRGEQRQRLSLPDVIAGNFLPISWGRALASRTVC